MSWRFKLRKNLVYVGAIVLVIGLALAALTGSTYEVKVQDLSIEKKDGYYALSNFLRAGEDFTAEFISHQATGRLRVVLISEEWYGRWREGEDVPLEQLLGDVSGAFGRIAWKVRSSGVYYLVLVPAADTSSWPFGVSVRLESKGGGEAERLMGTVLLLIGLAVLIFGLIKKAPPKRK